MTMRHLSLALALVVACGNDPNPSDDIGPDAITGPPVTVDVMPLCQTMTWESKVGQIVRRRQTSKVAVFNEIGPDTAFAVDTCGGSGTNGFLGTPTCPAGTTCTGLSAPTGTQCVRSYRQGTFIDGKLTILCSRVDQMFDDTGAETSHGVFGYDALRLTTY